MLSTMVMLTKLALRLAGVPRSGQMEASTKESGKMAALMERESSGMLMAMSMKAVGKRTKQTVMDCISMLMVQDILANGKTTCSTDKDRRPGLITPSMKESTGKAANTVRASTPGSTDLPTMEAGKTTKFLDSVLISGQMVESMSEIGRKTTCTDKENTLGRMAVVTRENT